MPPLAKISYALTCKFLRIALAQCTIQHNSAEYQYIPAHYSTIQYQYAVKYSMKLLS